MFSSYCPAKLHPCPRITFFCQRLGVSTGNMSLILRNSYQHYDFLQPPEARRRARAANSAEFLDYGFQTSDFCCFWKKKKEQHLESLSLGNLCRTAKQRVILSRDFRNLFISSSNGVHCGDVCCKKLTVTSVMRLLWRIQKHHSI